MVSADTSRLQAAMIDKPRRWRTGADTTIRAPMHASRSQVRLSWCQYSSGDFPPIEQSCVALGSTTTVTHIHASTVRNLCQLVHSLPQIHKCI
eukprot:3158779-Amphidinium_carterae.1